MFIIALYGCIVHFVNNPMKWEPRTPLSEGPRSSIGGYV